jgi:hypothetical protein
VTTVRANSEVRNYSAFGVLELKLWPNGYDWRFVGVNGSTLDSGRGLCHSALPTEALDFHALPPCRLVDTRSGSPLAAGVRASFPAAGSCGIPAEARALALNVTVVNPSAAGDLLVFPSGAPLPLANTVSFRTARTRAGNTVVALGVAGEIDVWSSSATHLVVDVTGYFY